MLKKTAVLAGAVGGLLLLAPIANSSPLQLQPSGGFEPDNSPNFVKCDQVVTQDIHPKVENGHPGDKNITADNGQNTQQCGNISNNNPE